MLRSRKSRREEPLGPHVPEPIVSREDGVDPEHEALLADSVGLALLVVLETLAPPERLAFVLHDMFARALRRDRPDRRALARRPRASSRAARAGGYGARRPAPDADLDRQREVVDAFLAAARERRLRGAARGARPRRGAPRRPRRAAPRARRGRSGARRPWPRRRCTFAPAGPRSRGRRSSTAPPGSSSLRAGGRVAVAGFTVARRPDRRDRPARRPGPPARARPERACRLAAGGRSAARDRGAACGRPRRPRRSRPARRGSSTPPRRTRNSGDTEIPPVRNARPMTRARRTRSSAASCRERPSPWASEPRCRRTPPARSRTKRAGRWLDMAAARATRVRRACTRGSHPSG